MSTQIPLVDADVASRWDAAFEKGSDKDYPSLDLVRLERWFFEHRPGRLLEYGFGSGVNLIHLLKRGYTVDAVDVAPAAKRLVETKLREYQSLSARAQLFLLTSEDRRLPFEDETYDYIVCMNVLSLLAKPERIRALIGELARVCKRGGKAIFDINSANSDFAMQGDLIGNGMYRNRGSEGTHSEVVLYCPDRPTDFLSLLRPVFHVVDVGYSAHGYLGSEIHEFIACAQRS